MEAPSTLGVLYLLLAQSCGSPTGAVGETTVITAAITSPPTSSFANLIDIQNTLTKNESASGGLSPSMTSTVAGGNGTNISPHEPVMTTSTYDFVSATGQSEKASGAKSSIKTLAVSTSFPSTVAVSETAVAAVAVTTLMTIAQEPNGSVNDTKVDSSSPTEATTATRGSGAASTSGSVATAQVRVSTDGGVSLKANTSFTAAAGGNGSRAFTPVSAGGTDEGATPRVAKIPEGSSSGVVVGTVVGIAAITMVIIILLYMNARRWGPFRPGRGYKVHYANGQKRRKEDRQALYNDLYEEE